MARKLIREGNAYMDNTPLEQMREQRMHGIESACRCAARRPSSCEPLAASRSCSIAAHSGMGPEDSMRLFEAMLVGGEEASGYCLRARIDMSAKNKALRDPVLYRSNPQPHARTGSQFKAYPTYDFACPIVDSVEGVTHAMRTMEFHDRDEQYEWLQVRSRRRVRCRHCCTKLTRYRRAAGVDEARPAPRAHHRVCALELPVHAHEQAQAAVAGGPR